MHKPNHYELIFFDDNRGSCSAGSEYEPHSLGSFDSFESDMPEKMMDNIKFFYYPLSEILSKIRARTDNKLVTIYFDTKFESDCEYDEFEEDTKQLLNPYISEWLKEIHETIGLIKFFTGLEIGCGKVYMIQDNSKFFKSYKRIYYTDFL